MLEELLGAELFAQVQEKLGDKKLGVVNDGSWLPKSKLDEKIDLINGYKAQILERDEQLAKLQPLAAGNQGLTEQIQKLQEANEAAQVEFQNKLKDTQLSSAIKLALNGKVQDLEIVSNLLDKGAIELDENGSIKGGLDEQVSALKESKSFLFVPDKEPEPKRFEMNTGTGNHNGSAENQPNPFASAVSRVLGKN